MMKSIFTSPQPKASLAVMILANLIPLIGVLGGKWDAAFLLWMYGFEFCVVGILTVVKMWQARLPDVDSAQINETSKNYRPLFGISPNSDELTFATQKRLLREKSASIGCSKLFLSVFFILFYGGFVSLYIITVYNACGSPPKPWLSLLVANIPLILSHLFSHFNNYILTEEYLWMTPLTQMLLGFPNILIILFSAGFGGGIQNPIVILAGLTAVKIGADWISHRLSRRFANARTRYMQKAEQYLGDLD